MNRKFILDEAIKVVNTDRNHQYGEPEDNFSHIAELWEAFLNGKIGKKNDRLLIGAEDVAIMMVLFKVGRMMTAETQKSDTFVDIAGYAACAGEICCKGGLDNERHECNG